MPRTRPALVLDDDPLVLLKLRIPASLHRTLERYCRYRGHDVAKIPRAASAAIADYFARDEPFQEWCREHPDLPDDTPRTRAPRGRLARTPVTPSAGQADA